MRCSQCTQGIDKNYSIRVMICNICSNTINLCPLHKKSNQIYCDVHTRREHVCLSKCLYACTLTTDGPKLKKRKIIKKKEINILHQSPISFLE